MHNPKILLKPRFNFKESLCIDFGVINITNNYDVVSSDVYNNLYVLNCKKFKIYTEDNFELCEPINIDMNLTFFSFTQNLYYSKTIEKNKKLLIDKTFRYNFNFPDNNEVIFKIRQKDVRSYFKILDLNLNFQDCQSHLYEFLREDNLITKIENLVANEEFMTIDGSIPNFTIILYDKFEVLSLLKFIDIGCNIIYYLNNEMEFKLNIEQIEAQYLVNNQSFPIITNYRKLEKNTDKSASKSNENNLIDLSFVNEELTKKNSKEKKLQKKIEIKGFFNIQGEKEFIINISDINFFFRLDFIYLMQNLFFYSFPVYDENSSDIPYKYEKNKKHPNKVSTCLRLLNTIICFLSDEPSNTKQDIACLSCNFRLDFVKAKFDPLEFGNSNETLTNFNGNKIKEMFSFDIALKKLSPYITRFENFYFEFDKEYCRKLFEGEMNFFFEYKVYNEYIKQNNNLSSFFLSKVSAEKITLKLSYKVIKYIN